MKLSTSLLPVLSLLFTNAYSTPTADADGLEERARKSHCVDFNLPVTAKATNKLIFSPTHDLNTVGGVTSFLSSATGVLGQLFPNKEVSGTYPMSMRYCPAKLNPNVPAARKNHVQLLLHGIPYTKNYWQGNGQDSSRYSWVERMNAEGYPVLTVDNLGNGNSTIHPNPIFTVQMPLEVEIYHQIVKKLRAGTIGHGVPKASKVIYGGHSYASVLGNNLMTRHPKDLDAAILTGYSDTLAAAVPGALLAILEPAKLYNPQRYGNLHPGYITFGQKFGKRQSYYAEKGSFSPAVESHDYDVQGITTIGEIITFFTGFNKAPLFKGDVMAVTGENDEIFCGPGSRSLKPKADCRKIVPQSGQFFPNANYKFYIPPGTSHATNLHFSSRSIFKQVAAFLDKNGY